MDRSKELLLADKNPYLYQQILKFSRSKSPNNPAKWYLIKAFDGTEDNLNPLKRLVTAHKFQKYERERALFFFNVLDEKGIDLVSDEELLGAYLMVARYLGCRIREIENWKPKSHNRYRILSEMVRFLYARYPVPAFMDSAFYDKNPLFAQWFIHFAQGGSVRKVPKCPIKLTAKMAHQFMHTPPLLRKESFGRRSPFGQYSVTEALRYAQVINMGGNERLVRTILATRLGQYFENDDFWETVIRFFIQNPMLEQSRIQPIVDYIQSVKFENRVDVHPLNYNQIIRVAPSLPNYSMKGRTVSTLLSAVDAWHRALHHVTAPKNTKEPLFWQAAPIRNFKHREGTSDENAKIYHIEQLITSFALLKEGHKMHHCVYSYTHACVLGHTSIWSMMLQEGFGEKNNLLTLEVSMPTNTIVQIRGKCNRLPSDAEMKVINRWIVKEDLTISKWVRF